MSHYRLVRVYIEGIKDLSGLSEKVSEALHERRVVRLVGNDVHLWVFNGRERDYVLIPKVYCSCKDFEFNVIMRGVRRSCYHLVTQYLAELTNNFRELGVNSETLYSVLNEIIYYERSLTLRKLLITSARVK